MVHRVISGTRECKHAAMRRREYVQLVRRNDCSGVRSRTGHGLDDVTGARIDGLDQAWLADRHVNETGGWIEKSHVRGASERPPTACGAGCDVDFDQGTVVTAA